MITHGPQREPADSHWITVPSGAQSNTVLRNPKESSNWATTLSLRRMVNCMVTVTSRVTSAKPGLLGSSSRETSWQVTCTISQVTRSEGRIPWNAAGMGKHTFSRRSVWKQKSYTLTVSMQTISVGSGHPYTGSHGPGTT